MLKQPSLISMLALAMFALPIQADLTVLQYHHVSDTTPPSTSTTPELFVDQLDMIEELELEVVPLDQGTREALAGELEERQQVAITFDDAYDSVWSEARPELLERNYPFTIFVNTDAIGRHGYMTWEQLKLLAANPDVLIANHSKDHGHLVRGPDEPENAWKNRIATSLDAAQTELKARLGKSEPMFAYPYGESDQQLEKAIANRNWLGYGQQSGPIGTSSMAVRLPRFPMATSYGQLDSLKDKLLSRALPLATPQLPDPVMKDNPPTLKFELADKLDPGRLTCFASGKGRIAVSNPRGQWLSIQPEDGFNSRRFRYNCTYPAGQGRFYWLSQQWLDQSQPED